MKAEISVLFTLGSKLDGSERLNTYAQGKCNEAIGITIALSPTNSKGSKHTGYFKFAGTV